MLFLDPNVKIFVGAGGDSGPQTCRQEIAVGVTPPNGSEEWLQDPVQNGAHNFRFQLDRG